MRIRVLALLLSVFLVTSCGAETTADDNGEDADSSQTDDSNGDGDDGGSTTLSDEDLADLLLTEQDLPTGFILDELTVGPSDDDDDDDFEITSGNPACGEIFSEDDFVEIQPAAAASADFVYDGFAPMFTHGISAYGSASRIGEEFQGIRGLLALCGGEELTMGDEEFTMQLTFNEASFPGMSMFGEEISDDEIVEFAQIALDRLDSAL